LNIEAFGTSVSDITGRDIVIEGSSLDGMNIYADQGSSISDVDLSGSRIMQSGRNGVVVETSRARSPTLA